MDAILIPAKSLGAAKLRLAGELTAEARRRLGLAMLRDVLGATSPWSLRFIVTPDPEVEEVARDFGCRIVADSGRGLNRAIEAGTAAAVRAGVGSLLVLPSDVPLVRADDVASIFSLRAEIVVVRSQDGGTTGLLRRPPDALACSFGPNSAARHEAAARRAGLEVACIELPSLRLDVDDGEDLARLAEARGARDSVKIARELLTPGSAARGL